MGVKSKLLLSRMNEIDQKHEFTIKSWENSTYYIHTIRAAGMYEGIRTGPHHVFRIQLTLSQPGGQIMPTTVLQSSPC